MLKKLLFVSIFLLTISEARENPFFPSLGQKDLMYSSNEDTSLPPLKRATLMLPATTRVIESVTVNYRNLDGSQDKKTIILENSVDWHLPLFISQSYNEKNIDAPKIKTLNKIYKKVASIKYADFFILDKSLKILTKDKLLRNFLLVKPHRIVLDFKKDTKLKSYVKSNPKSVFKKIRVGNHAGYYRVVVELDGYYRYKYKKIDNGYVFNLK